MGLAVAEREFGYGLDHLLSLSHKQNSAMADNIGFSVFTLWDCVTPHAPKANVEEASQYAAATAKHLFDRVSRRLAAINSKALNSRYIIALHLARIVLSRTLPCVYLLMIISIAE